MAALAIFLMMPSGLLILGIVCVVVGIFGDEKDS